jgi:hypothetical protein
VKAGPVGRKSAAALAGESKPGGGLATLKLLASQVAADRRIHKWRALPVAKKLSKFHAATDPFAQRL